MADVENCFLPKLIGPNDTVGKRFLKHNMKHKQQLYDNRQQFSINRHIKWQQVYGAK